MFWLNVIIFFQGKRVPLAMPLKRPYLFFFPVCQPKYKENGHKFDFYSFAKDDRFVNFLKHCRKNEVSH